MLSLKMWYCSNNMAETPQTHTDTEFDPSAGNPFVGRAAEASRRTVVEDSNRPASPDHADDADLTGVGTLGNAIKKHPIPAVATAVLLGAAGDAVLGDPIGTQIENLTTPDSIVAVEPVVDDGHGLIAAANLTKDALFLDAKITDPSKVDFASLDDVLHQVPAGTTRFNLELVDQGRTYTFKLAPEASKEVPSPTQPSIDVQLPTVPNTGTDLNK
jgi:hypothetical protein